MCSRWGESCAWKGQHGSKLAFYHLTWTEETALKSLRGALASVVYRRWLWGCTVMLSIEVTQYIHIDFVLYTVKPSVCVNLNSKMGRSAQRWHTPGLINWSCMVKVQEPKCCSCPRQLILKLPHGLFVIAPSPQLKLNPYSVNEHRARQWSLITQPSMWLPSSVTIADHHPWARWHRWQGLIGLTDRCQASWHVMANIDKREVYTGYLAEFLFQDWTSTSSDPIL